MARKELSDEAQQTKNDEAAASQATIEKAAVDKAAAEKEMTEKSNAKMLADNLEKEKLKPRPITVHKIQTVQELFPDEEKVTMLFPRQVILTTNAGSQHCKIRFHAGPNEVPVSLADHWYLRANGVTKYEK